ncbi:hypothetical protein ACFE04_006888 [Oxalis oulophora]
MDFFQRAKVVRLKSHHDKYLLAEDDEDTVIQDRDGTCKNARWMVEILDSGNAIRLKSCFGKYLTASNQPFLLKMTGKKVLQTIPRRLDSSIEWEPIKDGKHIRFKTRYGQFLRANGGLPPWRNSITHDIPYSTSHQGWVLWEMDILEIRTESPRASSVRPSIAIPTRSTSNTSEEFAPSEPSSPPSFLQRRSPRLSRIESDDAVCSPVKSEGRVIYYRVADDKGNVDETIKENSFNFKGNGVLELKEKLEDETERNDIIVCSRNPLNGKLYPLRLHLPPNNAVMHVVLLPSSSKDLMDMLVVGLRIKRSSFVLHKNPSESRVLTSRRS